MLKNVKFRIMPTILVIIFTLTFSIIPVSAGTETVIIGGEAFGLKLYCKGVMITHFESFLSKGQKICPAKDAGLKINDIIIKADNKETKSNEQIENVIKSSNGKPIELSIIRSNKKLKTKIYPRKNENNKYYIGIWVKDSCAGIGTISYYNSNNKTYGALGHGICDVDTGGLIPSGKGEILSANITDIVKSKNNSIGTLNGYFTDNVIGNIKSNTSIGVYGELNSKINKKSIRVASNDEIKIGKAKLITTLNGTAPKSYDIEIIGIYDTDKESNQNFVIQITDKKLLNKTGGIVQGMSGSPIIQNGKFAGALTHVFLEDCTRGYGIFAENMLKN